MKLRKIKKDKKGVSLMVGYVLLITIAIVMGAIVYQWMKSYVPRGALECPDGVSVYIKELECSYDNTSETYLLRLDLSNNGRFDVDGYYIMSAKEEYAQIAGIDISDKIVQGGNAAGGVVRWSNALGPGNEADEAVYVLDEGVAFIEVTPIIYETIENKIRLLNCGRSKVKEIANC